MKKRIMAILLTIIMLVGLLPTAAFAAPEPDNGNDVERPHDSEHYIVLAKGQEYLFECDRREGISDYHSKVKIVNTDPSAVSAENLSTGNHIDEPIRVKISGTDTGESKVYIQYDYNYFNGLENRKKTICELVYVTVGEPLEDVITVGQTKEYVHPLHFNNASAALVTEESIRFKELPTVITENGAATVSPYCEDKYVTTSQGTGAVAFKYNGIKTGTDSIRSAYYFWDSFGGLHAFVTVLNVTVEEPETTYTLTYDANAGTDTVAGMPTTNPVTITNNTGSATFTVDAATPTRTGYTFKGWADANDATTADYQGDATITLTKDAPTKTIYAVWEDHDPHSVDAWKDNANGTHSGTCTECDEAVTEDHTWNEGEVTKKATCTEAGVKTYTCTKCGATKTEPIDQLAHDLDHHPEVKANCVDKGWPEYWQCKNCKAQFYDAEGNNPAPGTGITPTPRDSDNHKDLQTVEGTPATCMQEGLTDGEKCFACDKETKKQETIEMLPHKFSGEYKYTETEHYQLCEYDCGTESEHAAHKWDDGVVTLAPTPEAENVMTYTCTVCGATKTESLSKPEFITVKFMDGTELIEELRLVIKGGQQPVPAAPEKDGYTFTGWTVNGKQVTFRNNMISHAILQNLNLVPAAGTLHIFATYERKNFINVIFMDKDPALGGQQIGLAERAYENGGPVKVPEMDSEGSWYSASTGTEYTGEFTYEAMKEFGAFVEYNWVTEFYWVAKPVEPEPETITVVFQSCSWSEGTPKTLAEFELASGDEIAATALPIMDGEGSWYGPNCETEYEGEYTYEAIKGTSADTTFTFYWVPKPVEPDPASIDVVFMDNDPALGGQQIGWTATAYENGAAVDAPEMNGEGSWYSARTRTEYTGEFTYEAMKEFGAFVATDSTATFYWVAKPIEYKAVYLTFMADGKHINDEPIRLEEAGGEMFVPNAPIKPDYRFTEWTIEGAHVEFADGRMTYEMLAEQGFIPETGDQIMVEAQYETRKLNVVFRTNQAWEGDEGITESREIDVNYGEFPAPTLEATAEGDFQGWTTEYGDATKLYAGAFEYTAMKQAGLFTDADEAVTFYPVFGKTVEPQPEPIEVLFKTETNEQLDQVFVNPGDILTVATDKAPAKEGLVCIGWSANGNGCYAGDFTYDQLAEMLGTDTALVFIPVYEEDPTPAKPAGAEIVNTLTVKCADGKHEAQSITLSDAVTIGDVVLSDGVYTCKIDFIGAKYVAEYNRLTGVQHKVPDIGVSYQMTWNGEAWTAPAVTEIPELVVACAAVNEYGVTYTYENAPEGAEPTENAYTYSVGQKVTIAQLPADVVTDEGTWSCGCWTWNGVEVYPNTQIPMVEGGLHLVATWTLTPKPDPEKIINIFFADETTGLTFDGPYALHEGDAEISAPATYNGKYITGWTASNLSTYDAPFSYDALLAFANLGGYPWGTNDDGTMFVDIGFYPTLGDDVTEPTKTIYVHFCDAESGADIVPYVTLHEGEETTAPVAYNNAHIVGWQLNEHFTYEAGFSYDALETVVKYSGAEWGTDENGDLFVHLTFYPVLGEPNEHGWDEGEVTTQPTCTEDGVKTFTCTVCGVTKTEAIPATGHTEEVIPGKEATCTEPGLTEGKKCSVCGEILVAQEEIPALGHTEEVVPGKEATCTEPGLTEGKKCSVCGEILLAQEEIPALGHDWNEGAVTTQPTCTVEGVKTFTCGRCGETKTEAIPATGHTEEVIPGKEATCTETGLTEGKKCSVCGEILVAQEEIAALGHDYGEWMVTTPATCTEKGEEERICTRDASHKETREVAALGHNWETEWTVDVAPTCTEKGSKSHHCTRCEAKNDVTEIPANGHTASTVWSTDLHNHWHVCTVCNAVLDLAEHTPSGWVVVRPATLTKDGLMERHCTVCDKLLDRKVIVAGTGSTSRPVDDWPFVDVSERDDCYEAVKYVYENGLMVGTSADRFSPNREFSRAMVAMILYRMEKTPDVTFQPVFPDVTKNAWYADAITWAYNYGVINGYSTGNFGPDDSVTVEQLLAILYRYAKSEGYDVSGRGDLDRMTDSSDISGYAVDAVRWAVSEGLISGRGRLYPRTAATRAQVAVILMNFCKNVL